MFYGLSISSSIPTSLAREDVKAKARQEPPALFPQDQNTL